MKLLIAIIFKLTVVLSSMAQNSQAYYQHITQAQLAFSQGEYKTASDYYAKAFQHKRPYAYDMYLAMQIELDYAGGREKIIKQYMQFSGGKGTDISGEAYLKIMAEVYPKFVDLPYLDELMEMYNNTEPSYQGEYKHVQAFETLRDKDQAIRNAASEDVGQLNIYKSHWSQQIKQVDDENMKKLLVLLQDTALNEYNCNACFQSMEVIIMHNAANGKTDWITPLQAIFNDGRMDVRRFVRMVDDAHNRAPSVSDSLKAKDLYYGSFNGIRLYNLMYYIPYTVKEKQIINQNRKKIGFMSLVEEIAIKTWQFQHNDAIRFYPFNSLMYSDDMEDEILKKQMLQEQEAMLKQAIEEQQKNGEAELIIVKK